MLQWAQTFALTSSVNGALMDHKPESQQVTTHGEGTWRGQAKREIKAEHQAVTAYGHCTKLSRYSRV